MHPLDFCQLLFCLFSGNVVSCDATLSIVDKAKILACLLHKKDIHKPAGYVVSVQKDITAYFDETPYDDGLGFAGTERIGQSEQPRSARFSSLDRSSYIHRLHMYHSALCTLSALSSANCPSLILCIGT